MPKGLKLHLLFYEKLTASAQNTDQVCRTAIVSGERTTAALFQKLLMSC